MASTPSRTSPALTGVTVRDLLGSGGSASSRKRLIGRRRGTVCWTVGSARISSGVPSREEGALVEHGDPVGDPHDELHLVLHEDDGAPARELADQPHRLVGLLGAHARGRLVEEQERRARTRARSRSRGVASRRATAWRRAPSPCRRGRSSTSSSCAFSRTPGRRAAVDQKLNARAWPCTATRTFSSTDRCGKMFVIWYDFATPRRATVCCGAR